MIGAWFNRLADAACSLTIVEPRVPSSSTTTTGPKASSLAMAASRGTFVRIVGK